MLCPGGQVKIFFFGYYSDKFGQSRGARLKFLFFFGCTHDLSTVEVTTGTPISVFVPNTDQRGREYLMLDN